MSESDINLPTELPVRQFVSARLTEIDALLTHFKQPQASSLLQSCVPRHMRRRAASNNSKRLPRRVRNLIAANPVKKRKKPSRRSRRKTSCLNDKYTRRQREFKWIETHIWHAKRFKISPLWRYQIPMFPRGRGIRAATRSFSKHCIAIDCSYLCCLELRAPSNDTILLFASCCCNSAETEHMLRTRSYCSVVLGSDSNILGPAEIIINKHNQNSLAQMWIWVHPRSYETVWQLLTNKMCLSEIEENSINGNSGEIDCDRFAKSSAVTIISWKDRLNKFKLLGPKSGDVLADTFEPAGNIDTNSDTNEPSIDSNIPWFQTWFNQSDSFKAVHRTQCATWHASLTSRSNLQRILCCICCDPRQLSYPGRLPTSEDSDSLTEIDSTDNSIIDDSLSITPLWNETLRHEISGQIINKPSTGASMPNLQPANCNSRTVSSCVSGWDVILPAEWGRPCWVSLQHHGAHAAGLRELHHITMNFSSYPEIAQVIGASSGSLVCCAWPDLHVVKEPTDTDVHVDMVAQCNSTSNSASTLEGGDNRSKTVSKITRRKRRLRQSKQWDIPPNLCFPDDFSFFKLKDNVRHQTAHINRSDTTLLTLSHFINNWNKRIHQKQTNPSANTFDNLPKILSGSSDQLVRVKLDVLGKGVPCLGAKIFSNSTIEATEPIGVVVCDGQYSHLFGHTVATGYCSVCGLLNLSDRKVVVEDIDISVKRIVCRVCI